MITILLSELPLQMSVNVFVFLISAPWMRHNICIDFFCLFQYAFNMHTNMVDFLLLYIIDFTSKYNIQILLVYIIYRFWSYFIPFPFSIALCHSLSGSFISHLVPSLHPPTHSLTFLVFCFLFCLRFGIHFFLWFPFISLPCFPCLLPFTYKQTQHFNY